MARFYALMLQPQSRNDPSLKVIDETLQINNLKQSLSVQSKFIGLHAVAKSTIAVSLLETPINMPPHKPQRLQGNVLTEPKNLR